MFNYWNHSNTGRHGFQFFNGLVPKWWIQFSNGYISIRKLDQNVWFKNFKYKLWSVLDILILIQENRYAPAQQLFKQPWIILLNTVTIWIPNTWIPDIKVVQYSNGKVTWFADHSNTRHFGPQTGFLSLILRPPFEYWTIWQRDTNLPFEYQTSPEFRWLLLVR